MENSYQNQPQNKDFFNDQPRAGLPGMLNVLTILTFIGCGIAYLSLIWSFFTYSTFGKQMADMQEMQDELGDNEMANNMMRGSIEMMQKQYDNRYILLVSGLLFTTMCLVGAMHMRKLKKSGFIIYTIGELAPVIITGALIGFSLIGGITTAVTAIFAILFVILYATQRKYLVHN